MGKVCKGSAIVVFILGIIGSIVLGNELGYDFNWSVFLYGIIASFLFCLFLYSIGEIIDQLETSNSNIYELYQLLKKIVPKEEKKTEPKKSYLISSAPTVKKTTGGWVCDKCGTKNDGSAQFCKDCGTYK